MERSRDRVRRRLAVEALRRGDDVGGEAGIVPPSKPNWPWRIAVSAFSLPITFCGWSRAPATNLAVGIADEIGRVRLPQ